VTPVLAEGAPPDVVAIASATGHTIALSEAASGVDGYYVGRYFIADDDYHRVDSYVSRVITSSTFTAPVGWAQTHLTLIKPSDFAAGTINRYSSVQKLSGTVGAVQTSNNTGRLTTGSAFVDLGDYDDALAGYTLSCGGQTATVSGSYQSGNTVEITYAPWIPVEVGAEFVLSKADVETALSPAPVARSWETFSEAQGYVASTTTRAPNVANWDNKNSWVGHQIVYGSNNAPITASHDEKHFRYSPWFSIPSGKKFQIKKWTLDTLSNTAATVQSFSNVAIVSPNATAIVKPFSQWSEVGSWPSGSPKVRIKRGTSTYTATYYDGTGAYAYSASGAMAIGAAYQEIHYASDGTVAWTYDYTCAQSGQFNGKFVSFDASKFPPLTGWSNEWKDGTISDGTSRTITRSHSGARDFFHDGTIFSQGASVSLSKPRLLAEKELTQAAYWTTPSSGTFVSTLHDVDVLGRWDDASWTRATLSYDGNNASVRRSNGDTDFHYNGTFKIPYGAEFAVSKTATDTRTYTAGAVQAPQITQQISTNGTLADTFDDKWKNAKLTNTSTGETATVTSSSGDTDFVISPGLGLELTSPFAVEGNLIQALSINSLLLPATPTVGETVTNTPHYYEGWKLWVFPSAGGSYEYTVDRHWANQRRVAISGGNFTGWAAAESMPYALHAPVTVTSDLGVQYEYRLTAISRNSDGFFSESPGSLMATVSNARGSIAAVDVRLLQHPSSGITHVGVYRRKISPTDEWSSFYKVAEVDVAKMATNGFEDSVDDETVLANNEVLNLWKRTFRGFGVANVHAARLYCGNQAPWTGRAEVTQDSDLVRLLPPAGVDGSLANLSEFIGDDRWIELDGTQYPVLACYGNNVVLGNKDRTSPAQYRGTTGTVIAKVSGDTQSIWAGYATADQAWYRDALYQIQPARETDGELVALKSLRNDQLACYERAIYVISGGNFADREGETGPVPNWYSHCVSDGVGLVSNRTFDSDSGGYLYGFAGPLGGVWRSNGSTVVSLSNPALRNRLAEMPDPSTATGWFDAHHDWYCLCFPTSEQETTFVFDFETAQWWEEEHRPVSAVAPMELIDGDGEVRLALPFATRTGAIGLLSDDYRYDGQMYTFRIMQANDDTATGLLRLRLEYVGDEISRVWNRLSCQWFRRMDGAHAGEWFWVARESYPEGVPELRVDVYVNSTYAAFEWTKKELVQFGPIEATRDFSHIRPESGSVGIVDMRIDGEADAIESVLTAEVLRQAHQSDALSSAGTTSLAPENLSSWVRLVANRGKRLCLRLVARTQHAEVIVRQIQLRLRRWPR